MDHLTKSGQEPNDRHSICKVTPSARLFAQLRQGGTDFSVRLRLSDWVTVAGVYAMVATHLEGGRLVEGQRMAAASPSGPASRCLAPSVGASQSGGPSVAGL